jgi:hypothetical protein
MPITFTMPAAAAALSSTMMMLSARFAETPKEATSAEKPVAAFEDRWQDANHAVLHAAVASRMLAGIAAPPPAAEQTVGRVQIAEASAADIEQFEAEQRTRATRDGICALGKRYYYIGRHQYWRCKRR